MKKLRWPTNKEEHKYMQNRQRQNMAMSRMNRNENIVYSFLKRTSYKWSRQSRWGYRIFDFWCHELGVAIEVDGKEHNKKYDLYRDKSNYEKSGIIVMRMKNGDINRLNEIISTLKETEIWSLRRIKIGLKPLKRDIKSGRVSVTHLPIHRDWSLTIQNIHTHTNQI